MTPQLVDLNADGHNDMVMATFEGTAFLIEGSGEGWKAPTHIVDKNESHVRISMYYDMDENEYKEVDRSTDDYETNPEHHMTSVAMVDWDEDGDLDMVQGAYEGALYLCLNEGSAQQPVFAEHNLQILADGEHLTIEGGLATPRVVDWDDDGLFDLLCGGAKGGVYFFRNVGKKGEPAFAAAETLIGKTIGQVEKPSETDSDDDSNAALANYLAEMMVPVTDGMPECPGTSFHLDAVDYDGDGDLDLLVGAQSYYEQEKKVLTDDETEKLAELQEQSAAIQKKMTDMYEGKERDELEELLESDEFKEVSEEFGEIYKQIDELEPRIKPANFIWLYRNNSGSPGVSAPATPAIDPNEFSVHAAFEPPAAKPGDEVTLTVHVNVPAGYHIYGSRNGVSPTSLQISESDGMVVDSESDIPSGRMVVDNGKPAFWLEGLVTIEQKMTVPEDFQSASVGGHIDYMMCDDKACQPPASESFTAKLEKAGQ